MRIGLYGGAFDPIHTGHICAAEAAMQTLTLDKLLLVPTGTRRKNQPSHELASKQARMVMTSMAAEQMEMDTRIRTRVLDIELKLTGKLDTFEVLSTIRVGNPNDELWLLLGSDEFRAFPQWEHVDELANMFHIAVFSRFTKDTDEEYEAIRAAMKERWPNLEVKKISLETKEVSSTDVRNDLRTRGTSQYLLPQIYGYILRNHLYGPDIDLHHLTLDELRPIALSYLKARRIAHVLGTEQAAQHLAEKYGADVEKARRAALLHDCAKRLDSQEQVAFAKRHHLPVDEIEATECGLLHAKNGAALARSVFGIEDDIYEAIYWHSTGKENMSLLEKIIYIADYIEPTRNFPEVVNLREAAERDLDEGVLLGLENTIQDTLSRGKLVHENSQKALDYLKKERNR